MGQPKQDRSPSGAGGGGEGTRSKKKLLTCHIGRDQQTAEAPRGSLNGLGAASSQVTERGGGGEEADQLLKQTEGSEAETAGGVSRLMRSPPAPPEASLFRGARRRRTGGPFEGSRGSAPRPSHAPLNPGAGGEVR